MGEAVIFGCGRIGLGTAMLLRELGVEPLLIDKDCRKLERVSRGLGFSTKCLDVVGLSTNALESALSSVKAEVAAVALPGLVGFEGLRKVLTLGFKWVIDVSFMREDPLSLKDRALSKGSSVIVDAGLAPGISNLLISSAYRELGVNNVKDALIFVGGLSRNPKCPLGLAGAWNVRDLLDEYVRPARIVEGGEVRFVDPLSMCGTIQVPGEGVFEYFVSDGLRTMIKSLKPPKHLMAEYTLRYPGHLNIMRTLKDLGFLRDDAVRVGNVCVKPIDLSARVLENSLSKCREDRVVMYVRVTSVDGSPIEYVLSKDYDEVRGLTAMTLTTSGMQACVIKSVLEGLVRPEPGVHGPEYLGLKGFDEAVLKCLSRLGVMPRRLR